MLNINFSHKYLKLTAVGKQAKLLQAIKVPFSDLSKDFIEYDTKFLENGQFKHYKFPKSDFMILLLFCTPTKKLFTTVRSYNQKKYAYYKASQGKLFDIQINKIQNKEGENGKQRTDTNATSEADQALHNIK